MKKLHLLVLALGLTASAPAFAQSNQAEADAGLRQIAASVGNAKLTSRPEPIYRGRTTVDPTRDPWIPITAQSMAKSVEDPALRRSSYMLTAKVDYDGDGVMDTAVLANNSTQGAVVVRFGAPGKRPMVVYKMDGRFTGAQEIVAAGRNRILLSFPGSSLAILSMEGGRPVARYIGD